MTTAMLIFGLITSVGTAILTVAGLWTQFIRHLRKEILPNGGSSMKDQLCRIEAELTQVRLEIDQEHRLHRMELLEIWRHLPPRGAEEWKP